MYLSRLTLDLQNRDARRWLADCHLLHTVIMGAFPGNGGETARVNFGVLFRVDEDTHHGTARVLVQSQARPHWAIESPGVTADGPLPMEKLTAGIAEGRRYRFRLRSNPTRRVHARALLGPDASRGRQRAEREESKGKRVEIRDEAARIEWLGRQGKRHGFRLVRATLAAPGEDVPATSADPAGVLEGKKKGMENPVTLGTALFEGELEVTDAGAFREALAGGIGPGKAFGCGLLSVAPVLQP